MATLGKILDRALSAYAQSDLDLQLKARFFLVLSLAILVVLFLLSINVFILNEVMGRNINHISLAIIACFFAVLFSLRLLIRGRFFFSAHLLVFAIIITTWAVILSDPNELIIRLDSFVYIISLLSLLPLMIRKHKSIIFFYGLINIAFLCGFMFYYRFRLAIPDSVMIDFLGDNILAVIASCCVAFSVFAINDSAIKRAKAEIVEREQAERMRARLESQLHQAQKMEAIGQLAGGVAHDFNNMLSIVIGNTELVMMQQQLDDQAREQLETIKTAVTRSARLIRQLLTFARKQTITPEILDINQTIADMMPMLTQLVGGKIRLSWHPGQDTGPIRIDPSQMDQVLTNLIVNARDAVGKSGEISLATRDITLDERDRINDRMEVKPGRYVLLTVNDNGCGMDRQTMDQVFEPFFSTKKDMGTGLGLATVYGIVTQNNGHILVESEPGLGTTFALYLPVIEDETVIAHPKETSGSTPARGSETILMVEDDRAILKFGATVLEQLGYDVLAADTPEEGLALAAAEADRIDLLLTDVIMPGMNGPELASRVREIIPGVKCLYISGFTADAIDTQGLIEQKAVFLAKPFSIRELAEKIREAFS